MALNSNRSYGFETLSLHAGQETADSATNARAVPIYQTSSFVFDSPEHAANLFGLKQFGNIYTRIMNPTQDAFERRIAALEGGVGALATSFRTGCGNSGNSQYCRRPAMRSSLPRASMVVPIISSTIHCPNLVLTCALWIAATPTTSAAQSMSVQKRSMPRQWAIRAWIRWIFGLLPISLMSMAFRSSSITRWPRLTWYSHSSMVSDIVVHSATKFIGGHGTSIGGVIVDSGKFDWAASGRFPGLTDPDPSYHGLRFVEALGPLAYIIKARVQLLRDLGPAASPFNDWLFLQGLETLPLRMERHSQNALRVAEFLDRSFCRRIGSAILACPTIHSMNWRRSTSRMAMERSLASASRVVSKLART